MTGMDGARWFGANAAIYPAFSGPFVVMRGLDPRIHQS
jgi:hypothetical protein